MCTIQYHIIYWKEKKNNILLFLYTLGEELDKNKEYNSVKTFLYTLLYRYILCISIHIQLFYSQYNIILNAIVKMMILIAVV